MKLVVALPREYEKKWNSISTFMGGDVDALIMEGLRYVWNRYGKEITACEREKKKQGRIVLHKAKLLEKKCLAGKVSKCDSLKEPVNEWGVFVGSYARTISTTGMITLPKDWVIAMRGDAGWLYTDKKNHRVCIVSNADANELLKKGKDMQPVILGSRNRIRVEKELLKGAGLSQNVELKGLIRYIAIVDAF